MTPSDRKKSRPWRPVMWGAAALLLIAPVVAMQFSAEMNWGLEDLAALAAVLLILCLTVEAVMRFVPRPAARIAIVAGVAAALLVNLAHLAVGIW